MNVIGTLIRSVNPTLAVKGLIGSDSFLDTLWRDDCLVTSMVLLFKILLTG